MNSFEQRTRLQTQIALNRQLILEAQEKCRELDALCAARKDAVAAGRRRAGAHNSLLVERPGAVGVLGAPVEIPARPINASQRLPSNRDGAVSILLVVDPETDDFLLLQRALRQANVRNPVLWAKNGAQAFEMTSHLGSNVAAVCLVTEVKLPDMDGFEALREIRSLLASKPMTVVFLTGRLEPLLRSRSSSCGANGFFVKSGVPGDLLEIAQLLRKLLGCDSD